MARKDSSTKEDNFTRRLRETMGTETDPEMYTPQTAGCEETEGKENFPIVEEFDQTNMLDRPHHGRRLRGSTGNTTGLGKDQG